MEPRNKITTKTSTTFSAIITQFLLALIETFETLALVDGAERARARAEFEAIAGAEREIQKRYAHALMNHADIRRRSQEHGVWFSPFCSPAEKAAILDFLDNPEQPTLLTALHMTRFMARGDSEFSTVASRTHPVNRAIYNWQAHHWASQAFSGHATSDKELHDLKTVHYPMSRYGWTAEEWADHEAKALSFAIPGPASTSAGNAPHRPGTKAHEDEPTKHINGVPLHL